MAQLHDGTMAQWHNGTKAQWHDVTMAQWYKSSMAQWHDSTMVRNDRNVRHHNWGVPSVRNLYVEADGRRDMISMHNFT